MAIQTMTVNKQTSRTTENPTIAVRFSSVPRAVAKPESIVPTDVIVETFASYQLRKKRDNKTETRKVTTPWNHSVVRFAEPAVSDTHTKETPSDEYEFAEENDEARRWYSQEDIHGFWQDTVHTMRKVLQDEQESTSPFYWTKAMVHMYKAFATPVASQNSLLRLFQGRVEIPDECVGLETSRTLIPLYQDFIVRRRALLKKIRCWQEQEKDSLRQQEQGARDDLVARIAEACKENSQVSVSYSQFVAKIHSQ